MVGSHSYFGGGFSPNTPGLDPFLPRYDWLLDPTLLIEVLRVIALGTFCLGWVVINIDWSGPNNDPS